MSSPKKIDLKRDFAAGVYLSEVQNPITPLLPFTHCIRVFRIQFLFPCTGDGGGGGRELNQRKGDRANSSQSWVENTNMTDCLSSL
jgi:hypothetical protein